MIFFCLGRYIPPFNFIYECELVCCYEYFVLKNPLVYVSLIVICQIRTIQNQQVLTIITIAPALHAN